MKKYLALLCALVLLLTGCMGTPVIIQDCTCSEETAPQTPNTPDIPNTPATPDTPVKGEGAVKTGLAVITTAKGDGKIELDSVIAAVNVDDAGVITSCIIDSIPATVEVDASGKIVTDVNAPVPTKNELGADYGMVAYGGAVAEWDAQVAALCRFAEGKTLAELKNGAIDETGKAPAGTDLASSATIYLGGFVSAIEAAVNNAAHLGASAEDALRLVTMNKLSASKDATAEEEGFVQLDADIAALTVSGETITSCVIDSVQAQVKFDASGKITSDLTRSLPSKNELGDSYGMVAYAGAIAEWNVQAAAFAAYVTGKTPAEVAGIAVSESTKPADGSDLSASVTIAIGGFQALIAKAFAQ